MDSRKIGHAIGVAMAMILGATAVAAVGLLCWRFLLWIA